MKIQRDRPVPEDDKALGKLPSELEEQIMEHARNPEFEDAASLRDEIAELREQYPVQVQRELSAAPEMASPWGERGDEGRGGETMGRGEDEGRKMRGGRGRKL